MAQQLLVWRNDIRATAPLAKLVASSKRPICRAQALCTLYLLGTLAPEVSNMALADTSPGVRRQALRVSEQWLRNGGPPESVKAVRKLEADSDPDVQLQWAYSLGESDDPQVGAVLGRLAGRAGDDRFLVAAVVSSTNARNVGDVLEGALDGAARRAAPSPVIEPLLATAIAATQTQAVSRCG